MRPIQLTIAGLHSFREKQEVDFLSLCEGGVFGIFGPTGSGKSSLLDAITLALYGKVERASNNTQGIMNHAENEIQVSFTFELGNSSGTFQYRVERGFKRTGDITLRTATCRLLELGEETIVLADKSNEVQQHIHELLGLTIDDFTRAVVLPQGKFAEFLSLKGSDRRQMLQRLFHLEQYGDQLNDTLRTRMAYSKGKVNEIIAEIQGLGKASKEDLAQAEEHVKSCDREVKKVEEERRTLQQKLEDSQKIWQWQIELNTIEDELVKINQRKESFIALEQQLSKAIEAQQLIPYLNEQEESQRIELEWTQRQKEVSQRLRRIKEQEASLAKAYQDAVKAREEQQPHWIERQSELKQAHEWVMELEQVQKSHRELQQVIKGVEQEVAEQKSQIERSKTLLDKAITRQREIKDQLEGTSISLEVREEVRQATKEHSQIENRKQQAHELQTELDLKKKKLGKAQASINGINEERKIIEGQAKRALEHMVTLYKNLQLTSSELQVERAHLNQVLVEKEKELEWQKERNLASHLAQLLKDGEQCPVCGSLEHPSPFETEEQNIEESSMGLEDLRTWVQKLNEQEHLLKHGKLVCEQMFQDVVHSFSDIEGWSELDLLHLTQSEVAVTSEEKDSSNANNPFSQHQLHKLINRIEELQLEESSIQEKSRHLLRSAQQHNKIHGEEMILVHSLSQDCQEREGKVHKLMEEIHSRIVEWEERFPKYHYENIAEEQEKLDQKDKEAQVLKGKMEQSIQFIEEKESAIRNFTEALRALQLKLTENLTRLNDREEYIERLQKNIKARIADKDVNLLLEEANQRLYQLKQVEQNTTKSWNGIRNQLQSVEKEEEVANQALGQANERYQKSLEQWKKVFSDSTFVTTEEVKQAQATKEVQVGWSKSIQEYRNQEMRWKQELERVEKLLGSERITEEEWQESVKQRKSIEEKWNQVHKELGGANQAFNELVAKHQRYTELENSRLNAEALLEKLGKLQAVFRGNGFVEYLAEEQLMLVCRDASERLGHLTRQRYALEVDSSGGFVIRDDANGGVKRPVSTLSGGETFLTSLALALALSAQIQLKGEYPLEFFFLDEGFGTLDQDLLDTVVTSLENLHTDRLSVGVISHVPELRARLPRRLVVQPAEPSGRGSRVYLETL
jgi:exonuclease SbcC